jgi:hypothetical protein
MKGKQLEGIIMGLKKIVAVTLSDAAIKAAEREAEVTSAIDVLSNTHMNSDERQEAAFILGMSGEPRALSVLVQVLQNPETTDQPLKTSIVTALGNLMVQAQIRRSDARALQRMQQAAKQEDLYGLLVTTLNTQENSVDLKIAAINALAALGDFRAVGPLKIALNDPEAQVKPKAEEALRVLATNEGCLPAVRRSIRAAVSRDTKKTIDEVVRPNTVLYQRVCQYAIDMKRTENVVERQRKLSEIKLAFAGEYIQVDSWHTERKGLVLSHPKTLLDKVAKEGLVDLTIFLVEQCGATVDLVSPPPLSRTALAYAVAEWQNLVIKVQPAQGQIEAAITLIGLGADLELLPDGMDIPPDILHQAARLGNVAAITYLTAGGGNPMITNKSGFTALYYAIRDRTSPSEEVNWAAAHILFKTEQQHLQKTFPKYDPSKHETYIHLLKPKELTLRQNFKDQYTIASPAPELP